MKENYIKYLFLISLFLLTILNTSCKTTEYVEVEKVRIDTLFQKDIQYDSIYIHEKQNKEIINDTVYITNEVLTYKEKHKTDTIYKSQFVQVPKPYEVIKKVPYIPKVYQFAMMFSIMMCIIMFFYFGNKLKNITSIGKWKIFK